MKVNPRSTAMRLPLAFALALAAAGCASTPADNRLAQADCKVYPVTTASAVGNRKPNVSPLEQRHAEMQLATSDYRARQLREKGFDRNNVEDALRDCDRR
jgi:hypothetical protein